MTPLEELETDGWMILKWKLYSYEFGIDSVTLTSFFLLPLSEAPFEFLVKSIAHHGWGLGVENAV
jgi:hypothetical protein